MGFFDFLFGRWKKDKFITKKKSKTKKQKSCTHDEKSTDNKHVYISPEIIAAISASISAVMSDDEIIAAIVAAIHHSNITGSAVIDT